MTDNNSASNFRVFRKRSGKKILSDDELMMEFESLGENAEFGCAQRACGAEPLGLLRFNTCNILNLCEALETQLQHLYADDDLEAFQDLGDGRFMCRSKHYGDFIYHTLVSSSHLSADEITKRERGKTAYLKRRLLEELSSGRKIFVRRGCESLSDLQRLRRALESYGRHELLTIVVADVDHPAGTVERIEGGLLRGYLTEFKVCSRPEPVDVASWLNICRNTLRLARPEISYALPRKLASGFDWKVAASATLATHRSVRRLGFQRRYVVTANVHTHESQTLMSRTVSVARLAPQTMVTFSAWVRVPPDRRDRDVHVRFEGVTAKHIHPADTRRLGAWQLIWTNARVPKGTRFLSAVVCAANATAVSIEIAGWCFEEGSAPAVDKPRVRQLVRALRERSRRTRELRHARAIPTVGSPASPVPYIQKAEILIGHGAFVEADDVLSEALVHFPDDLGLAKLYAVSTHNSGRYAGAVARWSRTLALTSGDAMCFAGLAANLREHASFDRAKDVIGSALARFPNDMVVLTEAARIADATHDFAASLPLWDKAIALHGFHAEWESARTRARHATMAAAR